MPNYKKLYHKLFNDITDTIRIIESTNDILSKTHFEALNKLKQAQIDAEEMYLDMCDQEDEKRQIMKLVKAQLKQKRPPAGGLFFAAIAAVDYLSSTVAPTSSS